MSENEFEKKELLREIVALHAIWENPDFEQQVEEVLGRYIVFFKNRLPHKEGNTNEIVEPPIN